MLQLDWDLVWPTQVWRPGTRWRSDRGSLARRVSQDQSNSPSPFPSASLFIYMSSGSPPVLRLHNNRMEFFSHPPESRTHFAPRLCCISRGCFWRRGVGSGPSTTICGMLVGDALIGEPLAAAGHQSTGLHSADIRYPLVVPATL